MSYTARKKLSSATEYSVIYNDMRGVDFSLDGSNISKNRFSYLENMYRDYDGVSSGMLESIPGFRKIHSFGSKINGLFSYKSNDGTQKLVVHTGNNLYDIDITDPDSIEVKTPLSGVQNTKSRAVFAKDSLFVLDGKKFYKISSTYKGALNEESEDIYIPTTYYNGEEYEQRNLLTRNFHEIYHIGDCDAIAHGTEGLSYTITDSEKYECAVSGYSGTETDIFIPSRVLIGDKYYAVKSIEKYAFRANTAITSCTVGNGVSYVGVMAFYSCSALKSVILPDTVTEIGNACFSNCQLLEELHIGLALKRMGDSFINTCPNLTQISYSGSSTEFAGIENNTAIGDYVNVLYDEKVTQLTVSVKIYSPCIEVKNVRVGNQIMNFRTVMKNDLCDRVVITLTDKSKYHARDIKISGILSSTPGDYKNVHRGFLASNFTNGNNVADVIFGCKIAESYDGRIFLTGNPKYPGFCFYSSVDLTGENNPLYYGEMNYFKDGIGNFDNIAMLASGDSLAVFKSNDDGGGSIYYHTPHDTGIDLVPRIYPVSYIHSGICAKGDVISFFDDPLFVSEKGISALAKQTINLQRSIATRSTNINPKLLCEDLSSLKLAVWRGYLVVLAGDHIYLADSRATFEGAYGDFEYEWYYLSGIGSYTGDSKIYKYSSIAHTGLNVHPDADTIAIGTVYSIFIGDELVYYIKDGNAKYEIYPTEEKTGGRFNPASDIISVENFLIFATENGDLLMFNNDKKGVAPPAVVSADEFDGDEYAKLYSGRLHPYYYSFAGHAPRYALQTKKDNCGIPHMEKTTVKGSLTLKCRAVSSGKLICEVGCDNTGYTEVCKFPSSEIHFSDVDFSNFSLATQDIYTVPIGEKSKGWVEKQITIYTSEYGSPFGIYTIAYRFSLKGRIKKSR